MAFVSWQFILFVSITTFLYYVLPKKMQWVILLLASYFFYSYGGVTVLGYLLFTTFTTYVSGVVIDKCNIRLESKKKSDDAQNKLKLKKKLMVLFALVTNFGLLFVIKYLAIATKLLNNRLGFNLPEINLLLPLGISFYMFQSIGYVIDVYRKKYRAEKNYFKFSLFVSFFPQMIQGPISRFDSLGPQLLAKHSFNFENMESGIRLILWGFFKKLLLADRAAVVVNYVFDNYLNLDGSIVLFGVILYCIQLYADFSGGIDITRGVAKLLDIDLIQNFKRPIFANSLQDYWRRWHISLGSWMKDYVFYPLSLSKAFINLGKWIRKHIKGKAGQIIPVSMATFVVYFLIGIWHGGNLKYIVFGLWNGVLITGALLLQPIFVSIKKKLNIVDSNVFYHAFCVIRTCFIVVIGRYITRAINFGSALEMLKITVTKFNLAELINGSILNYGITLRDYIIIAVRNHIFISC